jgi:hypothetical protein
MTAFTTLSLAANVVHGVPSGNYDGGSAFVTDSVTAANYYGGQGALQTLTYQLQNFVGNVTVQATLNDQQASAPWFDIDNYTANSSATGTFTATVLGNFSWIRAEITEFSAGNIQAITVAY